MGWLSSLFSSNNSSQNVRRGQAMSSTHDAFSLPTSSPIHPHPDAFNPDMLNTPDIDGSMSPTYSYPPQGGSYDYVPSSGRSQQPPLLPLHHDAMHSGPSRYPQLSGTWNRLRLWLSREYPELGDTLNYGILPQDLAQIEMQFGFALPQAVRESYLIVNGQEAESSAGCSDGLFFGLTLLPLDDVLDEWRFWREVDEDPATGANVRLREVMRSIPPDWIRKEYSQKGWIPLIADKAGNYVGVDLNPASSGHHGQVIVFGRDFDTKVVLWCGDGAGGWGKWLANFVDELEGGEGFEIGGGSESEGDEDDVGYESYYHDGTGRGQGDGGGDSGTAGGLKLTGEYRGWSVMEAWADRSLRKWLESGVITEAQLQDPQQANIGTNELEKIDLDISEQVSQGSGSHDKATLINSDAPLEGHKQRPKDLPTISVTKPPAPLPVELPTPRDIVALPSPPDSTHTSFDEDLEAGRRSGMYEVEAPLVVPRRPSPPLQEMHEGQTGSALASTVPLPTSPAVSDSERAVDLITPPPSVPEMQDLLTDSAPDLPTTPIKPSASVGSSSPSPKADSNEEKETSLVDVDEKAEGDVTIRLVGGGGTAGIYVPEEEQTQEAQADLDDAASVKSVASINSTEPGQKDKSHKKSKSGLASLKKLGLGGLKKKGSVDSVKDAQAPK